MAKITRITNRTALAANANFDWRRFGKDGTTVSTPLSRKDGNLKITLGSSSGTLMIMKEGGTWHGNFARGDVLIAQPYVSDNLIIRFSPPVSAAGAQIDPGAQGAGAKPYIGMFHAQLCLYDPSGKFLGMVARNGIASTAEDGSAPFIGARSDGAPIGSMIASVRGATPGFTKEGDLALNELGAVIPSTPSANSTAARSPQAASSCK